MNEINKLRMEIDGLNKILNNNDKLDLVLDMKIRNTLKVKIEELRKLVNGNVRLLSLGKV